jgi:hypothetical protein
MTKPRTHRAATLGGAVALLLGTLAAGAVLAACGGSSAAPTSPGAAAHATADPYVQQAGAVLDALAAAADRVQAATRQPDVASATGRDSLTAALDAFASVQVQAAQLHAPAAYAAAQEQLQQAADDFKQVADLLRGALTATDTAQLEQAAQLLPTAIAEAAAARADLPAS